MTSGSAVAAPRSRRLERGQASIEFVGLVPVVLTFMLIALQLMALAYTAHGASQAARDAARAYSLGQSPEDAARRSLPGSVGFVSSSTFGPHHGVRVVVQAPSFYVLSDGRITREVVMP